VNLSPRRGAAEEAPPLPPPPRTTLAGQPESLRGTWEEMGKMETARRLSEETR